MSVIFCIGSLDNSPVSSIDEILEMDSIPGSRELRSLAKIMLCHRKVKSRFLRI